MTWKPSGRKVAFSVAFAIVGFVLEWFLSAPMLDALPLGRAIVMGLVTGYLVAPWVSSVEYPPGYFRPTTERLAKALAIAGAGVVPLAALRVITHRLEFSVAGLLVALSHIVGRVYVKLDSMTQSPIR